MIKFITGQAGSGKSTRLMNYINRLSDEKKEICIIVPEQFSYEFDKNLYKHIGAVKFNQLFSLTFTALSRQLFQTYGDAERKGVYADDLSKIILMEEAIINLSNMPEGLTELKRQAKHQGFISQVLKMITDLKRAGITPYQFKEKSAFFEGRFRRKSDDISNIYLEYDRLMRERGLKDNLNDTSAAAKVAALNGYFKGKTVFIDEFDTFTGDQYEFIKVMAQMADNVYICLRTEDVNAGEFTLFESVNKTYRKIAALCREADIEFSNEICGEVYRYKNNDITYLSRNILRSGKGKNQPINSENIKIFEARDCYIECEYVCATIKRLIHENKSLRYRDIAVISNKITDYAGLFESTFERYGIPYFMSLEKSVSHTSIMVMVSSVADILASKKYKSELIFHLLKCELTDVSLYEISLLEDYCYKYGIDGDRWKKSFVSDDINAAEAEKIRKKVIEPLEKLKKNCHKADVKTICSEIYNYIVSVGADIKISAVMGEFVNQNKDYLASEQKRLWSFFIKTLDALAETVGDKTMPIDEFRMLLKTLLSQITFSVPPQTLDNVTVASARNARLNSPKVVFVMGANEGDFPNVVRLHGLLSEEEKYKFSEVGLEISRPVTDLIAEEKLIVYKSLSIASEKLYITYPLSDLAGQAKYPAMIVKSVRELFSNGDEIFITEENVQPHYYAVTKSAAFYQFMQWQKQKSTSVMSIKKLLETDNEYREKINFVYEQYNFKGSYHVEDNSLIEEMKSFTPLKLSPTRLEEYNGCHFKFFCDEILKLAEREKIELNSLQTGNIIHSCFNRLLSDRSKSEFVEMSVDELRQKISDSANEYKQKNMSGDFEITSRFDMNYKKFTQSIIRVAVHLQEELMISDFSPVKFEYRLGNDSNAVMLPFADGKQLQFGGFVDRIDTCTIGNERYIRVVDYKSHKKNLDAVYLNNGINMQMLLYLFALTEKGAEFSDYKTAGVLYSPLTVTAPQIDDKRESELNSTHINKCLKMSGVIVKDDNVLEAMENGIGGKYIPVKAGKSLKTDSKSACIPLDSFEKLREFSYKKLISSAESIYNGNFEANPFIYADSNPCGFCSYPSICGNTNSYISRNGSENDMNEINEIFSSGGEEE